MIEMECPDCGNPCPDCDWHRHRQERGHPLLAPSLVTKLYMSVITRVFQPSDVAHVLFDTIKVLATLECTRNKRNISNPSWFRWFDLMLFKRNIYSESHFLWYFLPNDLSVFSDPTAFSQWRLPNILEDCFCQYHWIEINISQPREETSNKRWIHMIVNIEASSFSKHQTIMTELLIFCDILNIHFWRQQDIKVKTWVGASSNSVLWLCPTDFILFPVVPPRW